MIYLGASSIFARKEIKDDSLTNEREFDNKKSAFKQGLFSNVLNPKVAMFFLTFLPQFVIAGTDTTIQLVSMGVIYTILSITWFFVYVFFINYLRDWLMSLKVQRAMDKVTGIILIGFGLKLAFEKQ
ncbi:LysE family translocator [Cytobacillus sp. S13-E01]|uniref:LysE family translocator n=1 Tax=Cytobacillus sp. S13-E01 TaxID=3031326 RepID=UPI0023D8430A|nr:LysE family translocator [Cytobacillus sp. S13-E01]MDF0728875.1 LysE family translocator [Cytobacillus sp. S13-E01]